MADAISLQKRLMRKRAERFASAAEAAACLISHTAC
jgi:hypothetical protein